MIDFDAIKELLERKEKELGLNDGFKFLYCPRETIYTADILFLSLNPGPPPDDIRNMRTVSDEEGNSYVIEYDANNPHMNKQFRGFYELLGVDPNQLLTGVVIPFRSNSLDELTSRQKNIGLEIGKELWARVLEEANISLIVAVGNNTMSVIRRIKEVKLLECIPSGWKRTKLRRFESTDGTSIIHLPHLSRFKLFSHEECHEPLRQIFKEWIKTT